MKHRLLLFGLALFILPFVAHGENTHSVVVDGDDGWGWSASKVVVSSTAPFTLEFWLKTTSTGTSFPEIVDTRSSASNYGYVAYLDDNSFSFSLACSGGSPNNFQFYSNIASSTIRDNTWRHFAIVKASGTGISNVTLYVDGATSSYTTVSNGNSMSGDCFVGGDSIWLSRYPVSSQGFISGKIDEVRFWNTARSASEVAANYNHQVADGSAGLRGYWRLNGTSTDLITSNGTSGQSGAPTFSSTDVPFTDDAATSTSATSTSVWFDGNDAWGYIAPDVLVASATDPFTLEWWFKSTSTASFPEFIDTRAGSVGYVAYTDGVNGINFSLHCTTGYLQVDAAASSSPFNGNWHYAAVTKSTGTGSTSLRMYFDGVPATTTVRNGGPISGSCLSTTTDKIYFARYTQAAEGYFTGQMDEVRIWNVQRDAAQILGTWNTELSTTSISGLKGLWHFNETSTDLVAGKTPSNTDSSPTFVANNPFGLETPQSFYAQISSTTAGVWRLRQAAGTSTTILKELPEGWVVYVTSTLSATGSVVNVDGYRWYQVVDMTDGTAGWMAGQNGASTETYLPYDVSKQFEFASTSAVFLMTSSTRAEKIVEALNWYWSHISSSTDTLYYTGFPYLFSATSTGSSTWQFPEELFYAIAAAESGGVDELNNEVISYDYGHGIMQLTTVPTSSDIYYLQVLLNNDASTTLAVASGSPGSPGNETHEFGVATEDAVRRFQAKYATDTLYEAGLATTTGVVGYYTRKKLNEIEYAWGTSTLPGNFRFEEHLELDFDDVLGATSTFDHRNLGSRIRIYPCENLQYPTSTAYIRKCYEGTSTSTRGTHKAYQAHVDYNNQTFKYYTNTSQSIYSNIKGGLRDLYNKYEAATSTATASGTLFQPYEREWIHATWNFNGAPSAVSYLTSVASKTINYSDYRSSTGTQMVATSSFTIDLGNKLRIADNYKNQVIVYSPVTVWMTDSAGRNTGVVNGVIKEAIPGSAYNPRTESAVVFLPDDRESFTYSVVGSREGTYGIQIIQARGTKQTVYGSTILTNLGAVHAYSVDWDVIRQGGNGVTVRMDNEGDGTIDRTVTTDAALRGLSLEVATVPSDAEPEHNPLYEAPSTPEVSSIGV